MHASHSIRRRAIAALLGAAVAASLSVAALAVRQHDGDLAARKGYKGGPGPVLAAGILTGTGKPVR